MVHLLLELSQSCSCGAVALDELPHPSPVAWVLSVQHGGRVLLQTKMILPAHVLQLSVTVISDICGTLPDGDSPEQLSLPSSRPFFP